MAKVHPHLVASSTCSSKQEVFTLWMKSLILGSNGCAVFDSNGHIIYRVDNYGHRCGSQVHVMDASGEILFTIVKKKFSVLRLWEGYRSTGEAFDDEKSGFRVRKVIGIRTILGCFKRKSYYKVVVRLSKNQPCDEYIMENHISKVSCKICDTFGGLVAEVKRKITTSGVVLGEDVLTMVVEPHNDHSLIMALVVVSGLIHHKL